MLDILAWAIVGVTIIFAGLPIVGSHFTSHGSAYWEDFGIGFTIIFLIVAGGGVGSTVIWAFCHVLGWA